MLKEYKEKNSIIFNSGNLYNRKEDIYNKTYKIFYRIKGKCHGLFFRENNGITYHKGYYNMDDRYGHWEIAINKAFKYYL